MKYGDIVLIEHEVENCKKFRPALIISSDNYNSREIDRIVLPISSNIVRECPDDIIVEENDEDFKTSGLDRASVIRLGKIFTADKNHQKKIRMFIIK